MSDDDSPIRRLVEKARPSGRLPALDSQDVGRNRILKRWKKLRENLRPPEPKSRPSSHEPSRYTGTEDEEDS